MTAGLRSMAPFHSARDVSYSASPGLSARPLNFATNAAAFLVAACVIVASR